MTARAAAHGVLVRVEGTDSFADILLDKALRGLDVRERALATELVYGALRWQTKIDWVISAFSKIKIKKMELKVLVALRLGVYQLLFLKGIPVHAAINETVDLVGGEGDRTKGFVNAVLRMVDTGRAGIAFPALKQEPVKYISVVFSHPEWLVARWIQRFGVKEAIELCQANLTVPPTTVRVNTLKTTREALADDLNSKGYVTRETQFSPQGLVVNKGGQKGGDYKPITTIKDDRWYVQDEASQLVSLLVAPEPGETVLDACAAPGGKTTHLAELMENSGKLIAMELRGGRLKPLKKAVERLGVTIVDIVEGDSTAHLDFQPSLFPGPEGAASHVSTEGFDAVLVDAPCTGLGVVGRNPDIKYKRTEKDIAALSKTQGKFLRNLASYVRPGGRLVYSVCSFEPEETDEVVEGFLKVHDDYEVEDASGFIPEGPGMVVGEDGFLRTYPHTHGMDGFFAARLVRKPA